MRLARLLAGQPFRCVTGTAETPVLGLTHDSRRVFTGAAFFCLPGRHHDGREFAPEAVTRGASVVVAENLPPSPLPSVTTVLVPDARRAFALAAAAWHGYPGSRLRLLAVTGTNGKTTVNHLVEAILRAAGRPTGLIGTVESHLGARNVPTDLTTPDALEIQSGLAAMEDAGLEVACLEASSHGLVGYRLAGCSVDVGILTNVARDHLEFHEDVRSYAASKLKLFQGLGRMLGGVEGWPAPIDIAKKGPVYGVLNSDDPFFDFFRLRTPAPYLAYGAVRSAHAKLTGAILTAAGSLVKIEFRLRPRGLPPAEWVQPASDWPEAGAFTFPHPGRHNVANLLAAVTVAWAEGCDYEATRRVAAAFPGVRGRWETVVSPNGVLGVVDFAHNPGGLARALETARLVARRRVILVFGCEGQKDRGKRAVMGAIASRLADYVVLTQDNTFFEDGRQILADIEAGLRDEVALAVPAESGSAFSDPGRRARYEVIEDRRQAIFRAAALAESGDLVVVAGRGHDVKLVFGPRVEILDDRLVLEEALTALHRTKTADDAAGYSHSMVEGGLEVTS